MSFASSLRCAKSSVSGLFCIVILASCKLSSLTVGKEDPLPLPDAALPPGATPVATSTSTATATAVSTTPLHLESMPFSFAPIAKRADPSVVTINTIGEELEPTFIPNRVRRRQTKGLGTGFIVQKDGVILTNNHVVAENDQVASVIMVKLSDDRELPAKVVGRDKTTDLAVLKVDANGLAALPLGDSDGVEVGDWVVAIGNPFGLSHTVSAGIISAKGRSRDEVPLDESGYYSFLQTDASINPGNSGGPLLNLRGEVVGVNTAIRGGGAQGIGFAIPVNMVKQIVPMLLRDGHFTRSAMGIEVRDVRELAPEDKALLKITEDKGVILVGVEPNGAAATAGLAPEDVILAFDGQAVDHASLLQWLASTAGVGRTVTVRVARAGKVFDQKVTLGQLGERTRRVRPAPQFP